LSTEKPIRAHDVPEELERIRAETSRLLVELNGRRPRGAMLIRAKNLRSRSRALAETIDCLVTEDMAIRLAFRQRAGREPDEDDVITGADDTRAEQIVAALQSKAGTC
jgi:hypothetical protein